ncbi:MAG TPA: OmpA family protein, partial [Acidocella sp.]|nr:OmpA family protein [Acidocella sp.]
FPSNWSLSSERAVSVVTLFETDGVAGDQLSAQGFGEFGPISTNDTDAGRALNRRVLVVVHAPDPNLPAPPAALDPNASTPTVPAPAATAPGDQVPTGPVPSAPVPSAPAANTPAAKLPAPPTAPAIPNIPNLTVKDLGGLNGNR